ncbi:MAG: hypothetical protein ABH873_05435 [Candidatus Firestonebacteria bacterium]
MMSKMILMLFSVIILISCSSTINIEKQKEYANALKEKGLFIHAINEFKKIQDLIGISTTDSANLSYIVGNIYMENLHDYENALASYIKVKVLKPQSSLSNEVNSKMIECFERLGKSLDATQLMEKVTTINKKPEIPKGTIVAKIRNRNITREELDGEIRNLPSYIQEACKDDTKKLEFLKQHIATELLYDAAKRKNFENDKNILERTFQAKRSLMVQKLLEEELASKIKITDSDLKLYYEGHIKDFVEKKDKKEVQKSFDEVKEQVKQAVLTIKEQEAYQELLSNLLKAEQVTIYEDIFKNK